MGACEKPERGPEWVTSENCTHIVTQLPAVGTPVEGTPFWGQLGGKSTKPPPPPGGEVVSLACQPDDTCGNKPTAIFTYPPRGWEMDPQPPSRHSAKVLSFFFLTKAKALHLQDGLTASNSPDHAKRDGFCTPHLRSLLRNTVCSTAEAPDFQVSSQFRGPSPAPSSPTDVEVPSQESLREF